MSDNFKPDSSIKKFLKEISSSELIKIINGILGTNYSLSSKVFFENTEHFSIKGDLDKSSVRGDLTIKLSEDEINNAHKDDSNKETTDKIVIEVQATKDSTMGFRMFIYSLNATELKKENENKDKKDIYVFPKGATIYTTLDLPTKGFDEVHMQIEKFRVGENNYSAERGDLLTVEFPFINILPMTLEELKGSDLEILKILIPYKYKKKNDLLKNVDEVNNIINSILEFTENFSNNDKIVISSLAADIFADVYEIVKSNDEKYREVADIMETAQLTFSQKVLAEGEQKERIKTARKMLVKNVDIETISEYTDLTIVELEHLKLQLIEEVN